MVSPESCDHLRNRRRGSAKKPYNLRVEVGWFLKGSQESLSSTKESGHSSPVVDCEPPACGDDSSCFSKHNLTYCECIVSAQEIIFPLAWLSPDLTDIENSLILSVMIPSCFLGRKV